MKNDAKSRYYRGLAQYAGSLFAAAKNCLDAADRFYCDKMIDAKQWETIRCEYGARCAEYDAMREACRKAIANADRELGLIAFPDVIEITAEDMRLIQTLEGLRDDADWHA